MSDRAAPALESLVRRDRLVLISAVIGISAIAWFYMVALPSGAHHSAHTALLAEPQRWTRTDLALVFGMWTLMMLAMMLPTAAPTLLTLARVGRERSLHASPIAPATGFLIGYALALTAFSLVAACAQWGLHQATWTTMSGESTNRIFAGAVLVGAGAFQFSRLKDACLRRCRSPLWLMMTHWRPGAAGGIRMGIAHGRFCIGCCWALMALMFVGGSMNWLWTAALALFMLVEKAMPAGRMIGRAAGAALIALGVGVLVSELLAAR